LTKRQRDSEHPVRPGSVRIEDVAKLAGVSPITVSRALSDPKKVREATRKKVEKAVAKTGYVVNTLARNLRTGRSSIISMFANDLQNEHFAKAIRGCGDALGNSAYHLMVTQTNYNDTQQHNVLQSVVPLRPAALIYTGVVRPPDTVVILRNLGIPIMEMWDFTTDPIDMLVGFSNYEGGRLVGRHFGELGFKNIAYAGRTEGRGALRLQGFQESLASFGATTSMVLPKEGVRTMSDGKEALATILAEMPACDAIFFGTDTLAIGAIFECRTRGITIPAELAIAGFGDIDVASQLAKPLTTVQISGYDMGYQAGERLLNRLTGRVAESNSLLFPLKLVVRASTRINR
jgi:LacI family gluconate utilization system Gnt-I transcriptional repressor